MTPDDVQPSVRPTVPKLGGITGRGFLPGHPDRWLPGRSGNPAGRPAKIAKYVQGKCGKDYRKLVDGLYVLALGTWEDRLRFFGESVQVTARDRRECISELFDRAVGRPQTVDRELEQAGRREIIISIPSPPAELEGRTVVYDLQREPEPQP